MHSYQYQFSSLLCSPHVRSGVPVGLIISSQQPVPCHSDISCARVATPVGHLVATFSISVTPHRQPPYRPPGRSGSDRPPARKEPSRRRICWLSRHPPTKEDGEVITRPHDTQRNCESSKQTLRSLAKFQDRVLVCSWRPPVLPHCQNRNVSTWVSGQRPEASANLSRTELSLMHLPGTHDSSADTLHICAPRSTLFSTRAIYHSQNDSPLNL